MPVLTERERIGTRLAEKYDLSGILGSGGMGTVYAGVHAWTGRHVAVKLLKPALAEDANVVRRFLREARAASSLRHPHVVDVLDMGQEADGAVYMVLELLEGESLGAMLRRRGKLPASELLPLVLPIADALVEVHAKGLIHRDLKPENVFIARGRGGQVVPKLLDFGIAKILEDTGESPGTRTGSIVGTPHYMSPEQAQGSRDIGPASDVWSLGVMLYECLSGALPYESESATGVLVKILTAAPVPITSRDPALPRTLVRIVEHAMQMDPAQRFLDVRVMRDALREAAAALGIALPETVPAEDISRTPSTSELVPIHVGSAISSGGPSPLESAPTMESQRSPARTPSTPADSGARVESPAPQRGVAVPIAIVACMIAVAAVTYALASGGRGETEPSTPPVAAEHAEEAAPDPVPATEPEPTTEIARPEREPIAPTDIAPTDTAAAEPEPTEPRVPSTTPRHPRATRPAKVVPTAPPAGDTSTDPERRPGVRTEW